MSWREWRDWMIVIVLGIIVGFLTWGAVRTLLNPPPCHMLIESQRNYPPTAISVLVAEDRAVLDEINKKLDDSCSNKGKAFIVLTYQEDLNSGDKYPVTVKSEKIEIMPNHTWEFFQQDGSNLIGFTIVRED